MLKILISSIVILLISCDSEPKRDEFDPARMERYIKYENGKFENAWVDYEKDYTLNFFTPDACIYPGSSPAICDTTAIKNFRAQQQQRGVRKKEMLSLGFEKVGDVVKEEGQYNLRDSNNVVIESGAYTITWKQHRGYWRYKEVRWMGK